MFSSILLFLPPLSVFPAPVCVSLCACVWDHARTYFVVSAYMHVNHAGNSRPCIALIGGSIAARFGSAQTLDTSRQLRCRHGAATLIQVDKPDEHVEVCADASRSGLNHMCAFSRFKLEASGLYIRSFHFVSCGRATSYNARGPRPMLKSLALAS